MAVSEMELVEEEQALVVKVDLVVPVWVVESAVVKEADLEVPVD